MGDFEVASKYIAVFNFSIRRIILIIKCRDTSVLHCSNCVIYHGDYFMNFFWHHVAKKGIPDLYKTVFQTTSATLLERAEEDIVRNEYVHAIKEIFPSGYFHCWGAPGGARSVIEKLQEGDVVLLHTTPNDPENIPVLCRVKFFHSVLTPSLSWLLWGDERYPYIFFFDAERIMYSWNDLKKDLEYGVKYRPNGNFNSIAIDRLEKWGGALGFLNHLQSDHGVSASSFYDATLDEQYSELKNNKKLARNNNEDAIPIGDINSQMKILAKAIEFRDKPILRETRGSYLRDAVARSAAFSIAIKRMYQYRCAICGAGARGPAGEAEVHAAHLFPVSEQGSNDVRNGICLCAKHHWALDVGWLAFSDNLIVLVHPNTPKGPDYDFINQYKGAQLRLPIETSQHPHPLYLAENRRINKFPTK